MRGFVTRSRPLHDRDLVVTRGVRPHDQVVLGHVAELARVGELDPFQHFRHELLGVIDELFHGVSPLFDLPWLPRRSDQTSAQTLVPQPPLTVHPSTPQAGSSSASRQALLTASKITATPIAPASTESRLRSPV